MAALQNKQYSTGTSTVGINTLLNMGLSATYQTVYNNKKQIANVYKQTIQKYISDNQQKFLILNIDDYHNLHESLKTLVVYYYDADLSRKYVRRFDTTKLVDFIPSDLKNINNYIKALTKIRLYLMNYIIPVPADFSKQLYIRRTIVQKLKYGNQCSISKEVLSLVPILGPLHVSLNTRERNNFNQYIETIFRLWTVMRKFGQKNYDKIMLALIFDVQYWTFIQHPIINTLKNNLWIFDEYPVENFHRNNFNQYIETIFRLWTVMRKFGQKNYDKIMLALIFDVQYWTFIQHPIINTLKNNLWIFDEYPVENFHSSKIYIWKSHMWRIAKT
ncbi:hypothetical protein Glove_144g35 [Diversispora epigaea]|uniref:Uncharacterized protein n=1 Tax=Diversispora epigaea TaxID=1348612 RepID=A0A397IU09_9GLOM|nr:hypothetical protein Glove_144g35 [Diversispora epigaea]